MQLCNIHCEQFRRENTSPENDVQYTVLTFASLWRVPRRQTCAGTHHPPSRKLCEGLVVKKNKKTQPQAYEYHPTRGTKFKVKSKPVNNKRMPTCPQPAPQPLQHSSGAANTLTTGSWSTLRTLRCLAILFRIVPVTPDRARIISGIQNSAIELQLPKPSTNQVV
jgi:hypothetical protein